MNSSLKAFFNPVQTSNKEVIVSNRFQEDGKPVPFVIKPVTQEENKVLIKKFTRRDKKGVETFDRAEYVAALTASAVVFPDLNNAELQKAYGVLGTINDPIDDQERAFIYGSILCRAKDEKDQINRYQNRIKNSGRRRRR